MLEERHFEQPQVDYITWDSFRSSFFYEWQQGEHVSILGATGQGKSILGTELIRLRAKIRGAHIVVFATKPRDESLERLGWEKIRAWPPEFGNEQFILWPEYGDPTTAAIRQRPTILEALRHIFVTGNRTIYFDEIMDVSDRLDLKEAIGEFWRMGRSNNLTVVAGTQRPKFVDRSMFSEPTWTFFFRQHDDDDLRRVGEIGGDIRTIRAVVKQLPQHCFLCVHRTTGRMVVSKVEV